MSLSPLGRVFRLFVPSVASTPPAPKTPPPADVDRFEPAAPVTDVNAQREAAYEQGRVLGAAAAERGEDCPVFPDLEGAGDPLAVSELQRGAQEAYAEAVEAQRQACFDSGFEAGLNGQPGLAGPDEPAAAGVLGAEQSPTALDTEVQRAQWDGYTRGREAGAAERIARMPKGAEEAVAYANNPPPNDARDDQKNPLGGGWQYWCLHLVKNAYAAAGNTEAAARLSKPTAQAAYDGYAARGAIQTEGTPPRGALVFFQWGREGHIGISNGDGTYTGTSTKTGWTETRPYTEGGSKYLGWALP